MGETRSASARLELLDGFELTSGGLVVDLPLTARRLVAFVALHDRPIHRLFVAGSLWLEASEQHANARLRTALWRLRRSGCHLIEARTDRLRLSPGIAVDARELAAHARAILRGSSDLSDGLGLLRFGAELLPDWYDDWVLVEREHLHQLRLNALETLCDRLAAAGRFGEAAEVALVVVAAEPLRETGQRRLISLYLAEGNLSEAVREYDLYRALLKRRLGLEPSERMHDLMSTLGMPGER